MLSVSFCCFICLNRYSFWLYHLIGGCFQWILSFAKMSVKNIAFWIAYNGYKMRLSSISFLIRDLKEIVRFNIIFPFSSFSSQIIFEVILVCNQSRRRPAQCKTKLCNEERIHNEIMQLRTNGLFVCCPFFHLIFHYTIFL